MKTNGTDETDKTVELYLEDLSNEAFYALFYSRALIMGGAEAKQFQALSDKAGLPSDLRRKAIQRGLKELADIGAVSLVRTGEGDYEPAQIHVKVRFSPLILREGV